MAAWRLLRMKKRFISKSLRVTFKLYYNTQRPALTKNWRFAMTSKTPSWLLLGALSLVYVLPAAGQSTFGSITGTITDQSGAVVPSAKITVTNETTGIERQVETTNAGVFDVANLNVGGTYRIRVEAPGFRPFEQRGLTLNANQVLSIDARLTLGSASQTLTVEGAAPTIDVDTATLSYATTSVDLEQLPLVARTAGDLGFYGYVYTNPGVSRAAGQSSPSINGMRIQDTAPTMDGIMVMAYIDGVGGGPVQPSLEGIQQVNIELAGTQAEFSNAANLTVVSKSGTNAFHGGAFYNYNGNDLNASNFFSATVPFRVYNNFGASLGGPIRKDKLFFFVDYEGSREAADNVMVGNTPLAAWQSGNFSSVSGPIVDPLTGLPFPNNQIPTSRISPVSLAVQNLFFPLPNYGPPDLQAGNWRGLLPSLTGYTHFDHNDDRADYSISPHDLIFARFSLRLLPTNWQDGSIPPAGYAQEDRTTHSAVLSWTHIFSPSIVNEFRMGMTRMYDYVVPTLNGASILQKLGIEGITAGGTSPVWNDAPSFNITGITSTSDNWANNDLNVDTDFEWTDNLSMNRGSHFLKFGFDAIRDQLSQVYRPDDIYGTYNFSGAYTNFGYADFLLGIPQTTSRTVPTPESYLRGNLWSFYVQDQFKVTRNFTLNYGVRWELESPYHDKNGLIYSFDRATGAIVVPNGSLAEVNPLFPTNIPIETASQAGYSNGSLLKTNKFNFYPRFGFAYTPFNNHKTVIRGGYGIYEDLIYGSAATSMGGGPYAGQELFANAIVNGAPLFSFPNPFGAGGSFPSQSVSGINPNLKTPYSQQFNLTVEHQIGEIGIRVAYVGTRSVDLIYPANINQPMPSTIPFTPSRYIYPNFYTVTWYDNGGTQEYNALQVSASKTYGNNLTFNTGWTWAKDLTDDQDSGSGFTGPVIQNAYDLRAERGNNVLTRRNQVYITSIYGLPVGKGQKFLSGSNRLVDAVLGGWKMSWVAELFSGQFFTPTFSGFDTSNTNNYGPAGNNFIARPDVVPGVPVTPAGGPTLSEWFNPAAFAIPGCPATNPACTNPADVGRFGNAGVNTLVGPDVINFDFSAMKDFVIKEHIRAQFRLVATNVFNHPNFSNPSANISSPGTVAQITSTFQEQIGEASRQILLGLRFQF
jgi:hypothetical protein